MSVFKACDIRGVYGEELDEVFARLLGRAIGTELEGAPVAVGGDARPHTPPLKEALIEGLLAAGARVIDLGALPTPAFYSGRTLAAARGGVMVTASHNPPEYNGFKVVLGDLPVTEEDLDRLRRRIEAGGPFRSGRGTRTSLDAVAPYEEALARRFPRAPRPPRPVVLDPGHGMLTVIGPRVLERAGWRVVALHAEIDGTFPGRDPNPAVASHLGELARAVPAEGAILGAAYDGDGDRVIFADAGGAILPAETSAVPLARALLAERPGAPVVHDIKCSEAFPECVRAAGGVPFVAPSGHAWLKRALLERRAVFGCEVSGHLFFEELAGDDTLFATLFLLERIQRGGKELADLVADVPRYANTPDIRIPCPADAAEAIVEEIAPAFPADRVDRIDGVRIRFDRGWALVRPSVTEPVITLRFEGRREADLRAIRGRVLEASPRLRERLADASAGNG